MGPAAKCVFDRTIMVKIPDPKGQPEPPFALPIFAEDIVIDGPAGKYRLLATFERGAAAMGGETEFYVADPAELPKVAAEVVLWGEDAQLVRVAEQSRHSHAALRIDRADGAGAGSRGRHSTSAGGAAAFRELAQRIARGSTVVFLSPSVFAKGDQPQPGCPWRRKEG